MDRHDAEQRGSDALAHFGVLGMRWGYRKLADGSYRKGFSFGNPAKLPPSEDAANAQGHRTTARTSGVQALSNSELQQLVSRLNLEQQYAKLTATPGRLEKGQRFTKKVLGVGATANDIHAYANSPTGKLLAQKIKTHSKKVKKLV